MRKFVGLTKRNLLIYFKDIQSIFFSMLTPIIVLVLYVLFLKGDLCGRDRKRGGRTGGPDQDEGH